ncbi:MAG: hypothetical protein ACIAS6_08555 [Phycisphaerales bacterium JB060]
MLAGVVIFFAGGGTLVALAQLRVPGGPSVRYALWAVIALGAAICGLAIRRMSRLFDRARDASWTLCPSCLYDLRGHDEEGECPECGRPFTRLGVQSCWINAHAFHTRYRE